MSKCLDNLFENFFFVNLIEYFLQILIKYRSGRKAKLVDFFCTFAHFFRVTIQNNEAIKDSKKHYQSIE